MDYSELFGARASIYLRKSRDEFKAEQNGGGDVLQAHRFKLLETANRMHLAVQKIYPEVVSGETEREDRRPIRVYGAGTLWAVQYADGTLRCNLHKKGGQPIERAVAVVENADRSLMLRDEDGFWDCAGGVAKAISEDAFVHCMMDRFLSSDVCESVTGALMQLRIRRNGEFEAM